MEKIYYYNDLNLPSCSYQELLFLLALPAKKCGDTFWKRASVNKIKYAALKYLLENYSLKGDARLKAGAELVIVGKSRYKQKALKERLAKFHIRLKTKVSDSTFLTLLTLWISKLLYLQGLHNLWFQHRHCNVCVQ